MTDLNDNSREEEEGKGLDLSSSATAALEREFKPEPWWVSTGRSFGRFCAKLLVALVGFLLDCVKGILTVVGGIFYGIYLLFKTAFLGIRGAVRYFKDEDWAGRLSFLVMGFAHLKHKVWADGVVYLAVEIIFIVWLAISGVSSLAGLSLTNAPVEGAQVLLIQGIFAIILVGLFLVVYYLHAKAVHDLYMIVYEPEYKAARKTRIKVLESNSSYPEILGAKTPWGIKKAAFETYGFSELESRYISYVPWKKASREYKGFDLVIHKAILVYNKLGEKLYEGYAKLCKDIRLKGWGDIFSRFLEWKFAPKHDQRGYQYLHGELNRELLAFVHRYDKYNQYHATMRDARAKLTVYGDIGAIVKAYRGEDAISLKQKAARAAGKPVGPQASEILMLRNPALVEDAVYGRDEASQARETIVTGKIKAKDAGFRISQAFMTSEGASLNVAKIFLKAAKKAKNEGRDVKDILIDECHALEERESAWLDKEGKKGETSPKLLATRLVGAFEIEYRLALQIAKDFLFAKKVSGMESKVGAKEAGKDPRSYLRKNFKIAYDELRGAPLEEILKVQRTAIEASNEAFEKANQARKAAYHKLQEAYANAGKYRPFLNNRLLFIKAALSEGLDTRTAKIAYANLKKLSKLPDGESTALMLSKTSGALVAEEDADFYGQPVYFKKKVKQFADEKFAITIMSLPVLGILVFSVVPLIFSILIAFTNWNRSHMDKMFTWNLDAWSELLNLGGGSEFISTFGELLLWTLVWAVLATFLNYIFGIVLALMINRKSIRLKKMWRTIFVVTIAVPQFITLLSIARLFGESGAVNTWLMTQSWYRQGLAPALKIGYTSPSGEFTPWPFPFLGTGAATGDLSYVDAAGQTHMIIRAFWPKMFIIIINMWVGIPYTMLSTSGILMNIPDDLYESAQIDGANKWRQFWSITMPYIIFVTGPSLLTQFIGNINNFNVIYFLNGGGLQGNGLYEKAGATSLLITWIYNLTTGTTTPDYSIASVMGCFIFMLCGFFSLVAYGKLGAVKNEEDFQ